MPDSAMKSQNGERMDATVREVEVLHDLNEDASPVAYTIGEQEYCRFSWKRGAGPPFASGIYLWLSRDERVLYVGKATSNRTSNLYRRFSAYKRATPGKTQFTSLRLNAEILDFVRRGEGVRLVCLAMPDAGPTEITKVEEALVRRGRPPWNRQGNPFPRSVEEAMPARDLLGINPGPRWPATLSIHI